MNLPDVIIWKHGLMHGWISHCRRVHLRVYPVTRHHWAWVVSYHHAGVSAMRTGTSDGNGNLAKQVAEEAGRVLLSSLPGA